MAEKLRNVKNEPGVSLDPIAATDVTAKTVFDVGREIHIHQIYDFWTQVDTTQDSIEMLG